MGRILHHKLPMHIAERQTGSKHRPTSYCVAFRRYSADIDLRAWMRQCAPVSLRRPALIAAPTAVLAAEAVAGKHGASPSLTTASTSGTCSSARSDTATQADICEAATPARGAQTTVEQKLQDATSPRLSRGPEVPA